MDPGAFVEIANDYDDFARAFWRKLLRELTPLVSQNNCTPRALVHKSHADQPNFHQSAANGRQSKNTLGWFDRRFLQ